jgi:hypothetical protein
LELREDHGWDGLLPRWSSGLFIGEERHTPAVPIALESPGDGMAVHRQMGGGLAAAAYLPGLEKH